jgi:hypothetical protein
MDFGLELGKNEQSDSSLSFQHNNIRENEWTNMKKVIAISITDHHHHQTEDVTS